MECVALYLTAEAFGLRRTLRFFYSSAGHYCIPSPTHAHLHPRVSTLLAALCDVCAPAFPMVLTTCSRLLGDNPRIISIEPGVSYLKSLPGWPRKPSMHAQQLNLAGFSLVYSNLVLAYILFRNSVDVLVLQTRPLLSRNLE